MAARCGRCGYDGCDVRITDCGCSLHVRCTPSGESLKSCPTCRCSVMKGLQLLPMSFEELDAARKAAAAMSVSVSGKRGKKRKSATIARLHPEGTAAVTDDTSSGSSEENDLRTGRWTHEETRYCDKLIEKFSSGELPLVEGVKLNEFLAKMLKSKQSRLTKKMKNAKLSTRIFKRSTGYIVKPDAARHFSELEDLFFRSITCTMERAEIRFHIQKEWRERFSTYCIHTSRNLDAAAWLFSVEELDRRMSRAKDAARMHRRKLMMGYALSKDSMNPDRGVIIDRSSSTGGEERMRSIAMQAGGANTHVNGNETSKSLASSARAPLRTKALQASPFLARTISFLRRHNFPFEYVDAWVPSFVPSDKSQYHDETKCRLCFAGSATADQKVAENGRGLTPLTPDDLSNLSAFEEYSEKFSFVVGCGLPGRVYRTGVSSWEQNVQNAPHRHFERCGGASQWGLKTALAIPVPSPNVGRIVVVFYSLYDRNKNQDIVTKLCDGLTKFFPFPKWKLVVDIGSPANSVESKPVAPTDADASAGIIPDDQDSRVNEIASLIGEHLLAAPTSSSSSAPLAQGLTSLRLTLLKACKTEGETNLIKSLLDSYTSYLATGRPKGEVVTLLVQDYLFLSRQPIHSNQSTAVDRVLAQMSPLQMLSTAGSPALGFLEGIGQAAMLPMLSQAAASASHTGATLKQDAHHYSAHNPHESQGS